MPLDSVHLRSEFALGVLRSEFALGVLRGRACARSLARASFRSSLVLGVLRSESCARSPALGVLRWRSRDPSAALARLGGRSWEPSSARRGEAGEVGSESCAGEGGLAKVTQGVDATPSSIGRRERSVVARSTPHSRAVSDALSSPRSRGRRPVLARIRLVRWWGLGALRCAGAGRGLGGVWLWRGDRARG